MKFSKLVILYIVVVFTINMLFIGCKKIHHYVYNDLSTESLGFEKTNDITNTYKRILKSEISFKMKEYSEGITVDTLLNNIKIDNVLLRITRYSLTDMNRDGLPELILESKLGGADFVLVLHYENREVKGYMFSNRQISEIKTDGTFFASGGAGDYGICMLEFDVEDYNIITCAKIMSIGRYEDIKKTAYKYYLGDKEVSEYDFELYCNDFKVKKDIIWCDF